MPSSTSALPSLSATTPSKPKCLETRKSGSLTLRRYRKANGRIVRTMELPWSLWLRVRASALKGLPGFERTEAARDRIAEVEHLLRQGHKSEYVAAVAGLTGQRVRQIKGRMKAAR